MNKHEIIECPSCGEIFECKVGSFSQCHCFDIRLTREQTEYLAEKWDGCLCHKCLHELAQNWDEISDDEKGLGSL